MEGMNLKKVSFVLTGIFAIFFVLFVAVTMINLLGGISSNGENFAKNFNGDTFSVSSFKKKFGFKTSLIALDFKFGKEGVISVKADELSVRRSIFSSKRPIINLTNGEVVIYLEQKQNLMDGFYNALNIISSSDHAVSISFENTSFVFISKVDKTRFIIDAFTGNLNLSGKKTVKGDFMIGSEKYEIDSFIENNDFETKLSSSNLIFKANLIAGKGKAMFSINNLSKFLNDITPDTLNIDLKSLDGAKNTIYFESDILYNDVKKSVDFTNSKIQAFGGKEEEVKIEPLSNDLYKISLNLSDLTITPHKNLKNIKINEGKLPALQFGGFFPELNFEFVTSIGSINIADGEMGVVKNFKLSISLGEEMIKGNLDFLLRDKFTISAKGLMQNYESRFRKGMASINIKSSNYENKNIVFDDFLILKNLEPADLEASINIMLAGETAIVEADLVKYGENKIVNSKIEFDIYSPRNNYSLTLNAEGIDFAKLKIKQHPIFTSSNQDLFKIMFDYLKFKNFNYINFTCTACKAGDEVLNVGFKQSVSSGKIELESFVIDSENIIAAASGFFDIRSPEKNIFNLFIEVGKADKISVEKIISIAGIADEVERFKLPSLDSFSGTIGIKFNDVSNGVTIIQEGNILLGLNYGALKSLESGLKLNGVLNSNWLSLTSNLNGSNPDFIGSANLSGILTEDLLSFLLKKEQFEEVKGLASMGVGFSTRGFLLRDLIKNLNLNIEAKAPQLIVKDFNIDAIAQVLLNENISFKRVANADILERRFSPSTMSLTSTMKFVSNEITIEAMELKGVNSTNVFVGRLTLGEKPTLQMLGKTATVGANLNNNLKGAMPIYLTSSVNSKEEGDGFDVKIDPSQINKYAEARRVLYK